MLNTSGNWLPRLPQHISWQRNPGPRQRVRQALCLWLSPLVVRAIGKLQQRLAGPSVWGNSAKYLIIVGIKKMPKGRPPGHPKSGGRFAPNHQQEIAEAKFFHEPQRGRKEFLRGPHKQMALSAKPRRNLFRP